MNPVVQWLIIWEMFTHEDFTAHDDAGHEAGVLHPSTAGVVEVAHIYDSQLGEIPNGNLQRNPERQTPTPTCDVAAREFVFWSFHWVGAADSFKRMSPELVRRFNRGPPPLILPRKTPGFGTPDTVMVIGIAERTFPPLLSAAKSIATPRGSATLMSPPDTSSCESACGCSPKPTMMEPLDVCATTSPWISPRWTAPPEFFALTHDCRWHVQH